MRQSPVRKTTSWAQTSAAPHDQAPTTWRKAIPGLSWLAVMAATACAIYGIGHLPGFAHAASQGGSSQGAANSVADNGKHGAANCTLIVPPNPLSATGLATPYQLSGTTGGAACHEANAADAAFVQAAAIDPATGQISIYNPLVVDAGSTPAVAPVTPTLPNGAVVAIWFGSNANTLILQGADNQALNNAQCVNGLGTSVFGQMAYCNATAFFQTANQAISSGTLTVPPLGTGRDGQTCPTVRDFSVVDQDQSDNVTTSYRITQGGQVAQNTSANAAALAGSTVLKNGSDNGLLSVLLDGALGCTPWRAPDLADPGKMVPALPLDELQAAADQANPVALVPSGDPMTLVNGHANLQKQNLYRVGVDQPTVGSAQQAQTDQIAYCRSLLSVATARLQQDRVWTSAAASPDAATADSLFTFLAARLNFTLGPSGLNCTGQLNVANPVTLTLNNGVVVDASFTAQAGA